jgi:hypothetical protein
LAGPVEPADAAEHAGDRRVATVEASSRHPVWRRNRGDAAIEGGDRQTTGTVSSKTGLVNPNSRMLPAICATCASECVRALRV